MQPFRQLQNEYCYYCPSFNFLFSILFHFYLSNIEIHSNYKKFSLKYIECKVKIHFNFL